MASVNINIDVDDLEKAIRFYADAFELHVGRRFGPNAAEMLGAEVPLYLLQKTAGTEPFKGAPTTRDYSRHWTPVHYDFTVPNLERAIERAVTAGAKRESEIASYPWGRIAMFADPFGHGFCIVQFSEQGYDAIKD